MVDLWTWKAGGGRLASGVQASGWLLSCERRAGGAGEDRGGWRVDLAADLSSRCPPSWLKVISGLGIWD
uniref:Uncharacterized protein n=1 Tax=Fagus sylvatica TaxID=28930 RepID=A0A2N9GXD1_FAGSY